MITVNNCKINDSFKKIYLDYNATTPVEQEVIEAINHSLKYEWYNPSGLYDKSKSAKSIINEARENISTMLNAESPFDIVFTSGGTESNNMVFYSVLNHFYSTIDKSHAQNDFQKPHFIISSIEHDSVKLIADYFVAKNLAEITEANVDQNGIVNVTSILDAIKKNTILISVMLANNETGVIQPISALCRKIKELGYNNKKSINSKRIYIHTDAAQAIGKLNVDVVELDIDYLTIVGHKFYGPRVGALYARKFLSINDYDKYIKAPIYQIFFGGGQENSCRPGTENTPMISGLGKAAELVHKNLTEYCDHMKTIRDYLEDSLESVFGKTNISFNSRSPDIPRLPNTCSVSFIESEKLSANLILNTVKYLEASTGASCHSGKKAPSRVLTAMGIPSSIANNTLRLSVGRETTKEQIDIIVNDLKETIKILKSH